MHGFEWTHTLQPDARSTGSNRAAELLRLQRPGVYEDFDDPRYDLYGAVSTGNDLGAFPPGYLYDAILAGVSSERFIQNTNVASVMAGSISQVLSREHQLKSGFEWTRDPGRVRHAGLPGVVGQRQWIRHVNEPANGFPAPHDLSTRGSAPPTSRTTSSGTTSRFRGGLRFEYFDARTVGAGRSGEPGRRDRRRAVRAAARHTRAR